MPHEFARFIPSPDVQIEGYVLAAHEINEKFNPPRLQLLETFPIDNDLQVNQLVLTVEQAVGLQQVLEDWLAIHVAAKAA